MRRRLASAAVGVGSLTGQKMHILQQKRSMRTHQLPAVLHQTNQRPVSLEMFMVSELQWVQDSDLALGMSDERDELQGHGFVDGGYGRG